MHVVKLIIMILKQHLKNHYIHYCKYHFYIIVLRLYQYIAEVIFISLKESLIHIAIFYEKIKLKSSFEYFIRSSRAYEKCLFLQ